MKSVTANSSLIVTLSILSVASFFPNRLYAQQGFSRFFIHVAGGANYFPFQEWGDFYDDLENARYVHAPISFSPAISIGLRFASNQSLSLEVEKLTSNSSLHDFMIQTNDSGDTLGVLSIGDINWNFSALPISINYRYRLPGGESAWQSYLGLGLSYFSTKVATEQIWRYDPFGLQSTFPSLEDLLDTGYGVSAMAGIEIPLTGSVYLSNQLRYRWASAFGDPNDVTISFTGYDFSIGLSWNP